MTDIDNLFKQHGIEQGGKSLIDLTSNERQCLDFDGYILSKLFDVIILVELIDEDEQGNIQRNGIYVPTSNTIKTWRKGKVVLKGKNTDQCDINDIVIFPHDKGIIVTNVDVKNYGIVKKGMFLNQDRIFGVCENKK